MGDYEEFRQEKSEFLLKSRGEGANGQCHPAGTAAVQWWTRETRAKAPDVGQ
jgi:hypothetical protein